MLKSHGNNSITLPILLLAKYHSVVMMLVVMGIIVSCLSTAQADLVTIASETFSKRSWHAGTGWSDVWYHEGNASIISTGRPYSSSYHMCLRASDAWIDRQLDLSGYDNARLGLYVKVRGLENDDVAQLLIKSNNSDWTTLQRFTASDSDNTYHYYEFDLTPYGLTTQFSIGLEADMRGRQDILYVDDIRIFTDSAPSQGTDPEPAETNPEPVFGVTIDDISNASAIKDSLSSLARRPFARIVFDEYVPPSTYKDTVANLHSVAGIMGEILDSYNVQEYSQEEYEQRTRDYVGAMADEVDIWEVGNEINGEWLGSGAMDRAASAYDIVKSAKEPAALTLYYNGTYDNGEPTANNCWEDPGHQMQIWAKNNVPERLKQGLDWVLVSFYEEDCENISPNWDQVFQDLHAIFPNSKLGFGEVGSSDNSQKETILRRYYGQGRIRPEFIGGFFWWYFKQDMVPKTKELWGVLNEYAHLWDEL
jgi:hypothetical protein